jgi:hypothetical protein
MNMGDSDHHNRREKAANMLLLANGGKLKVEEAMRLAGLSHKDLMNRTAQMQVRHMAEKLKNERKSHRYAPQALQSTTTLNFPPLTTVLSLSGGIKRKMMKDENGNKNET